MSDHSGHHGPVAPTYTPAEITRDVVGTYSNRHPLINTWTSATGALLALGIVGLIMKLASAPSSQNWGYYAATVSFILCTFQAAPLAAIATRLVKGDWRRPFTRPAELFVVVGFLNFLLMIPLLMKLPVREAGQRTIWFGWPGSPYVYEILAFLALPILGCGLLYASTLPDWKAVKDAGKTGGLLHLGNKWIGTMKQWRVMHASLTPLGGMYLAMFIFAGLLFSTDASQGLVPGWIDAIYPAYYSIMGIQGGIATLILALAIMRRTSYKKYVDLDQFWGLSKLLLAFSLLWFYFWWSAFILFWYGKLPRELQLLQLLMFGPYVVPFVISWLCSFALPLGILMWNPIRKSIKGPIVVSCLVLVGNLFNNIRLFVGPWSLDHHGGAEVEHIPAFMFPDLADILMFVGFVGGSVFLYLLALRLVPVLSMWEMREGLLYRRVIQYVRARAMVVAKPE